MHKTVVKYAHTHTHAHRVSAYTYMKNTLQTFFYLHTLVNTCSIEEDILCVHSYTCILSCSHLILAYTYTEISLGSCTLFESVNFVAILQIKLWIHLNIFYL